MTDRPETQLKPSTRKRLLGRLDAMVRSGRVTSDEAARLRAAADAAEFDTTITDIRVRHATRRLDSAVDDGALSRQEDNAFIERLRRGEHSAALRAHLRDLVNTAHPRRRAPAPDSAPPRQEDPE